MRSYNIAVFQGSRNTTEYEMPVDTVRALNRIEGNTVIHINHKKIYGKSGALEAPKIIDKQLKKNNIDIVIFGYDSEYDFSIEYFSKLRENYFMVLLAWEDSHFFEKSSKYYSQAFDLVSTEGNLNVQRYAMYGVDAIPYYGAFDTRNWLNLSCEKTRDLCFVGSTAKIGRREYLKYLVDNKVNIEIFGGGTAGGVISYSDMNRLYCSSKIGLSLSGNSNLSALDKDITINRRIKPVKGRSQEIALTGTFVLSEYSPGVAEIFEVGSEIDVFSDRDELLAKIRYYLEHETEREEMATRAFKRAVRDYDEINVWKNYMEEFHKKIEIKKKKDKLSGNIIYKDPIFKRAFSAFHLYKILEFFLRGMLGKALAEFVVYVRYPFFDRGIFLYYVNHHVVSFLGSIRWLRCLVKKIKKCFEENVDKV